MRCGTLGINRALSRSDNTSIWHPGSCKIWGAAQPGKPPLVRQATPEPFTTICPPIQNLRPTRALLPQKKLPFFSLAPISHPRARAPRVQYINPSALPPSVPLFSSSTPQPQPPVRGVVKASLFRSLWTLQAFLLLRWSSNSVLVFHFIHSHLQKHRPLLLLFDRPSKTTTTNQSLRSPLCFSWLSELQ